jgi:hypothetical protein
MHVRSPLLASCLAVATGCGSSEPAPPSPGFQAGGSGGSSSGAGGAGGSSGTAGTGIAGVGGGIAVDAGGQTDGGGCAYASVKSDLLPANLLFVVDRSGSMNCNLPPITDSATCERTPVQVDFTQDNKWKVVTGVIKAGFAALPSTASAGLAFFNNDDYCGVNSKPSVAIRRVDAAQISALGAGLDGAPTPKGGTPVVGALMVAYRHLHEQANVTGNKFVVLLSDGAESCDKDQVPLLLQKVPEALSVNIRTFVIGAPGSEPARAILSEIAHLGGTATRADCAHGGTVADRGDCHFDMTTSQSLSQDLARTFSEISGQALGCEFDLPQGQPGGAPIDPNRVNVRYKRGDGTEMSILKDADRPCESGAEGWQYTADQRKIVLCGSICREVKADASAQVDIVLGCQSLVR